MSLATAKIIQAIRDSSLPYYRGSIHEYARKLNLQSSYAVKGQLDLSTARHLIPALEAIRDPNVRKVVVQAAVQTMKSLIADIVVPYWIEHDPGDILWLFENDDKAKEYGSTRAMPLIRSIPSIHRMLIDVDRHDKTKTEIHFSHCKLVIAGLNESNVQTFAYRYVIIDEGWMSRATGLIKQAIYRTTQYADTKKILLLGQGGFEDEDADKQFRETEQRILTWACPFCGFRQPFELSRLRPEDFKTESLRGTFAGLSWDTNDTTKPNGRWNYEAVGRSAHYRCFECDARIEDRPEIRRQLNDSYAFEVTNPGAPRDSAGFQWPAEASMRISFASQAVDYLRAKMEAEELGYRVPLQIFMQKDRGLTWSDAVAEEYRATTADPYDAKSDWPDEAHRVLLVDCQRDLKKFWLGVFAFSLSGEIRELARGPADSFEDIVAVQTEWKVKDQQVYLDCGYEMTKVLRECVRHGHVGSVKVGSGVRKVWLCWTGLKGSGQEIFKHLHPRTQATEWRIYSERKFYNTNVGTNLRGPRAPWYEWSNLHCKDLLRARREAEPGLPPFRTLPDTLPSTDPWSYFAQMRSEKRVEEYAGGKKRAIWKPIKETRPNHYWDIGAMLQAVMAIYGVIGTPEVTEITNV